MTTSRPLALAAALALLVPAAALHAATIRLQKGGEFTATVTDDDGERLSVSLSRKDLAAIDGKPLPPLMASAFAAADLAGVIQRVPDPDGHPVVLQFWASWCPFCRGDAPEMAKLFHEQDQRGVRVMTVSVDEDMTKLRGYVRNTPIPYPVIAAYEDKNAPLAGVPSRYKVRGLPTYVIIDGHGVIVKRFSGSLARSKVTLDDMLASLSDSAKPAAQ